MRDASGNWIPVDSYSVHRTDAGEYLIRFHGTFDFWPRNVLVNAGFYNDGELPPRELPPVLADLSLERIEREAELWKGAGFTHLGNQIALAARGARKTGTPFSVRDLETLFKSESLYSFYPAREALLNLTGNPYAGLSDFANEEGKLCGLCNVSEKAFRTTLGRVVDPEAGVKIEERGSYVLEPGKEILTAADSHVTTRVTVPGAGAFEFDATAIKKDPRAPTSEFEDAKDKAPSLPQAHDKPKMPADNRRQPLYLVTIHEDVKVPPPDPAIEKLRKARQDLVENRYVPKVPRGSNSNTPSEKVLKITHLVMDYLHPDGRMSLAALSSALEGLRYQGVPPETFPITNGKDLRTYLTAVSRENSRLAQLMTKQLQNGSKSPYAIFGSPLLTLPIQNLYSVLLSHDWENVKEGELDRQALIELDRETRESPPVCKVVLREI